ncbi:MAG: rhomboid family intramembrane serine protease [Actinomycetota bacterium]|nr:rhomboid family intramembrane serine protease [Actinomycetota bacterium]
MFPIKDNIPTERFPLVTVGLILINFVAYVLAIRHGGSLISGPDLHEVLKYGATPYTIAHNGAHCAEFGRQTASGLQAVGTFCNGQRLPDGTLAHIGSGQFLPTWETVLSSMFMHASILHIAGNMLFLWIFGNNLEDAMGPVKFLLFYLAGGLAALGLQIAVDPSSTAPTLGASGAIAAVLGGYIVLYPRARVLTVVFIVLFFTVIELPAWVMLGIWFAEQAVFGVTNLTNPTGSGGGVAYFAHVGGFVFGLLAVRLLVRRRGSPPVPTRTPVY